MTKKISWGDIHDAKPSELKRIYKLDDMGLEKAVRRHMDGANPAERRRLYENVYSKKIKG